MIFDVQYTIYTTAKVIINIVGFSKKKRLHYTHRGVMMYEQKKSHSCEYSRLHNA